MRINKKRGRFINYWQKRHTDKSNHGQGEWRKEKPEGVKLSQRVVQLQIQLSQTKKVDIEWVKVQRHVWAVEGWLTFARVVVNYLLHFPEIPEAKLQDIKDPVSHSLSNHRHLEPTECKALTIGEYLFLQEPHSDSQDFFASCKKHKSQWEQTNCILTVCWFEQFGWAGSSVEPYKEIPSHQGQ